MVGVAVASVENRYVQRAVIEQIAVGLGVFVVDLVAADEFVDEFAALIVAHVHHGVAVAGFRQGGVFVFEAAQCGALDRGRLRVERIDLHHPAVTIEFVGVLGQVETRIMLMPVDLFAGCQRAIAFLCSVELLFGIAAAEAIGEVLFAGQESAPRRLAVGAVLECAEHGCALRIGAGFEQVVPGGRAAQLDRRITVDASVVTRVLDELPVTVFASHFNHRHPLASQGFVHILGRLRHASVGEEVAVVGVFVVDRHQRTIVVAGKGKQAHAVVVVAELDFLLLGAAIAARIERRAVFVQGLAPTDQH
ncbi:hypothetical protein D3C87_1429040 [compost metagenome]